MEERIKQILDELEDIEWYSPTVPKNWQYYHAIIRELCEKIKHQGEESHGSD